MGSGSHGKLDSAGATNLRESQATYGVFTDPSKDQRFVERVSSVVVN